MSLTLEPRNEAPNWISGSAYRSVMDMLRVALEACKISGAVQVSFSREQQYLKRKLPARSVTYNASHRQNSANAVAVVCVGPDARNDICLAILNMPQPQANRFRDFMFEDPLWEMPCVKTPSPALPEELPASDSFDDATMALYLDSLQEMGGLVTRATASVASSKACGSESALQQALSLDLLNCTGELCQITAKGLALHGKMMRPAPASLPADFEALRQSIQEGRRTVERLQAAHNQEASARTDLYNQLSSANQSLKGAEKAVQNATERLSRAKADHSLSRNEVLRLEALIRDMPEDATEALSAARAALQKDEATYRQLVEI